jgi:hypothetical protein
MDPTGLLNDLVLNANQIDRGRAGFTVDGEEHNGRINYERGISGALAAFQEAQATMDPQTMVLAELAFLQQELQFCNEADNETKSSLAQAIQGFEDALRACKAVQEAGYKTAEKTYPRNSKYRFRSMPKDAFHIACISHRTRIQNILKVPGMNMTDKAVYQQRFANMSTAQHSYFELQQKRLFETSGS